MEIRQEEPPARCHSCNVTRTSELMRGPDGANTLCYGCGLYYAKLMRSKNEPIEDNAGSPVLRPYALHKHTSNSEESSPSGTPVSTPSLAWARTAWLAEHDGDETYSLSHYPSKVFEDFSSYSLNDYTFGNDSLFTDYASQFNTALNARTQVTNGLQNENAILIQDPTTMLAPQPNDYSLYRHPRPHTMPCQRKVVAGDLTISRDETLTDNIKNARKLRNALLIGKDSACLSLSNVAVKLNTASKQHPTLRSPGLASYHVFYEGESNCLDSMRSPASSESITPPLRDTHFGDPTGAVILPTVAGVAARKRDKPLPSIVVDEGDTVAFKRARNTAAARMFRAKKLGELERWDWRMEGRVNFCARWKPDIICSLHSATFGC